MSAAATASKLARYGRVYYAARLRHAEVLPYPPEEVSLEVTNSCNYRCSFCPQSDPAHHDAVPRSMLSPDEADLLLGKLRRGGVTTDLIHWTLDGEPFVNKRFAEICSRAIAHGFTAMIFA